MMTGWLNRLRHARLSLARRILIGALAWSAMIVIGTVVATTTVYQAQSINLLDAELDSTLVTLARAIKPLEDGSGRIEDIPERLPSDPRYDTPLSGQYWVIIAVDQSGNFIDDIRPRSVWDGDLPLPDTLAKAALNDRGTLIRGDATGPAGEPLRLVVQAITIPNRETPILLTASVDKTQSNTGVNQLLTILVIAMLALAGGTLLAMAFGLQYALRPLQRIQADLTEIREGRTATLNTVYPAEVQPLTEELNKLLDHNRNVVSRARTHVGNLAHALKTPLAVLRNEAAGESQLDDVVRRQTETMRASVDTYLRRAQAAARAEALGVRTEVSEAIEALARMMNKLFAAEGKSIRTYVPPDLFVRTERQDLDEVLGNLIDNACKWAKARVDIRARHGEDGFIIIHVDDDGPGLSPEERELALKRGVRLDETAPGTGLGLSIVSDIAGMNAGGLSLSESPLGGLRATVKLRRA